MEFCEWLAKQSEEDFRSFLRQYGHEVDGPLDPSDLPPWMRELRVEYEEDMPEGDRDFSKFLSSMMPEHRQALIDFTYYALGKNREFLLDADFDNSDQWEAYHQWVTFQRGHSGA